MTNLAKLAGMTPAEIDTELARLWGEKSDLEIRRRGEINTLQAIRDGVRRYSYMKPEEVEATIAKMTARIEVLTAETEPFEDEYTRRGGWLRYFLVDNTNGHVHRGMHCSTCYWDTRFSWLIDLADCDEGAMIEEWGEQACTVCFPEAPTNPFYNRPSRRDREALEARAAEKAEREAKKNAKAIFDPVTGGPLRVFNGTYTNHRTGVVEESFETINTKIAARNELSRAVQDLVFYGTEGGNGDTFLRRATELRAALVPTDIDGDKIIANAFKKATKDGGRRGYHAYLRFIGEEK